MTITTTDGRTVDFSAGQRYRKVGTTPMNSLVYTDVTVAGQTFAGPTVTAANWAAIDKAQRAIRDWCRADSKATGYYKQSRYWIVNPGTGSDKQIDQAIDRMNLWERKRDEAAKRLSEMGVAGW